MRSILRAAVCSVLAFSVLAGPVSAAAGTLEPLEQPARTAQAGPVSSPAPATGTITGVVTNTSGTPLSGVAVTVTGAGRNQNATTNDQGIFSFTLPAGFYSVDIARAGFQPAESQSVGVVNGSSTRLSVTLQELSTQSLRTIGRTASSYNKNPLNTNVAAITTLSGAAIQERSDPLLSNTVTELPGVSLARTTGATANTFFIVRGAELETRVNIDGHPLASGTFGAWNTNYANSFMFDQVEVLKGAGLNGPTAGESAIGTVNLRTRNFTSKNTAEFTVGMDNFSGQYYNAAASVNTLHDRLSLLVASSYAGYNGPYDGYNALRVNTALYGVAPGTGQVPTYPGLGQWVGDFSNRQALQGQLVKARYRLSPSTSLTGEFLGLQGQYRPQGGSYGAFYGNTIVQPCILQTINAKTGNYSPGAFGTGTGDCNASSLYNPPYLTGSIGTTVPGYFWFPQSTIQNNEPQFSAELRTTIANDTLLIRPYKALINRFIDGAFENQYPGNNGGWYQVTNINNCQVNFVGPNGPNAGTSGAKGPCFNSTAGPTSPAYVGNDTTGRVFPTTGAPPTCTTTNPCYTTPTAQQNDGLIGYGTPFSQPEVDRLAGVTFQYFHPVHDNLYSFSYDYNVENTTSYTADTTIPPAGCTFVYGNNVANKAGSPGAQPTCPLAVLPKAAINVPPTTIRKSDFALTALFQTNAKTQIAFGNYFTYYSGSPTIQDPTVLATYAALGNISAAPLTPLSLTQVAFHYDPHVGITYRPGPNTVLRFTGGSSISTPYASQISGVGSADLPNGANGGTFTFRVPNPNLNPETVVAYDLGGDLRLADGGLFSVDAFSNTIHNAFISYAFPIAPIAGITAPGGFFQQQTINGPLLRTFGLELSAAKNPTIGFGYYGAMTFTRSFLDQLPQSLAVTRTNLINGAQLQGQQGGSSVIPYAQGYGELRYAGVRNSLITFGVEYNGPNNSTNGPPYYLANTTLRYGPAPKTTLQLAVQNLFGYNTGSSLGRALFNQGRQVINYGPAPGGAPGFTYGAFNTSLQEVPFRTFRLQLTQKL